MASVFKALSPHFSDYAVYAATNSDILIVAKREGKLGKPDFRKFRDSDLGASLHRIGIRNDEDLQ
ncbi:MAG: hypothetical protein GTO41_22665, partial [Burkholderiales bacterium]|nr:hypothetical protein [Burkholderiales bacterium]